MNSPAERPAPPGDSLVVHVGDETELPVLARRLVSSLPASAFVGLEGDLGAGKTTFVKAIAAAAGFDPAEVLSPTFGLIHEHAAPRDDAAAARIVHADMYRLPDAAALHETGWEDAIAAPGWVFVEWPGRISAALPGDRLDVSIAIRGPRSRAFTFLGRGPRHGAVVAALRAAVG